MHKLDIDEVVNLISYRTEDGMVNWKNKKHVAILEDILMEQSFPAKFIKELIDTLNEATSRGVT